MKPLRLSEVARMAGGRLHGEDVAIDAVATDTRAMPESGNPLFVALKGERFDGHDHVAAAVQAGAIAVLAAQQVETTVPQVIVADTRRALADLARAVQSVRVHTKVVAITGSNGKTSVKALTEAVLSQAGDTYATPGNRNNEIGMPLAVLDAPEGADFAIYEMGTGAPGDISYLTSIAPPDIGLVNNVAPAHLERMGSLLEIANTKAAVYDDLRDGGVAVVNADDAFAPYFAERAHGRQLLRFGIESSADVSAREIRTDGEGMRFVLSTPQGDAPVRLQFSGRHNVRNALAASAIALGAGMTLDAIVAGLQAARPVAGRQLRHVLGSGAVLVDDSYNANPGSLAAAIDTLAGSGAEAWLVLGDMRELGADEVALHAHAGAHAKSAGIARLYTLGPLSAHAAKAFGEGAHSFDSHEAIADAVSRDLHSGVCILVKGSRGSAMDRVVRALLGHAEHKPVVHGPATHGQEAADAA